MIKACADFVSKQKKYFGLISLLAITSILGGCNISTINPKKSDKSVNLPIQKDLVLHLETDSGVATQGNQVTGWIDNSLLGNDLIASGNPLLIADGLNGQPTIRFDGDDDRLERTTDLNGLPNGNSDRTIFMVAKYNGNGYGGFTYGQPSNNSAFGLVVDQEGDLAIQAWGADNDNHTKVHGNGAGWLTQSAKLEGGILNHYKDSVQLNSDPHNYNTIVEQMMVGAEIDGDPYVDMEIAAIIIFNRALNEDEMKKIDSYLQNKYFLAS